jgi:Tol biopolymer transport system component
VAICAIASTGLLAAIAPGAAQATFPGHNGMLVALFSSFAGKGGSAERATFVGIEPNGRARRIYYCTEFVGNCGQSVENPSVSPDGKELAFDGIIETSSYITQNQITLLRFGKFGLKVVPFTTSSEEENDTAPAWIPGRNGFVFSASSSYGGPSPRLDSENAGGSGLSVLVHGTAYQPEVSPDGRTVLYDHGPSIWDVGISGGIPTMVVSSGSNPSWAPNGKRIAYVSGGAVYVASATGAGAHQLAPKGSRPVWSPDGKLIAYAVVSGGGKTTRIYTRPANGGVTRLMFTERISPVGIGFGGMDWQAVSG